MLVLSRKPGEKVQIGKAITIMVLEVNGNRVRIGIDAPTQVPIVRGELCDLLTRPVVSGEQERYR
jgi:carbon storage regulator